jgi:hypothetical protein
MNKFGSCKHRLVAALALASAIAAPQWAGAQIVTNWAAFNDHRPGPLIPPHVPVRTNWGTARWVTTYDMGAPADTPASPLTNFLNGQRLSATVTFTRTGAPDDFGTVSNDGPRTNTPAGELFFGIVDLSNDGIVGVDQSDGAYVTITFNNLDPFKRYLFRGTGARGGGYLPRWSVATITNALEWIDAHTVGVGSPGLLTSNNYPANLGVGQVAWNSGDNVEGDLIGWDFIAPAGDGSFSIVCGQYLGPHPQGVADSDYAYSFGAMLLAEVEAAAPLITTNPPALSTVEQNRPFSLEVAATGTPLLYQWYKEGLGEIPGATFPVFTVSQAALGDAGNYYAVVYNPLGRATSAVAQVIVNQDVTPPTVATAFSYPTVPWGGVGGTLNQIIIEFDELVAPGSAGNRLNYTIAGLGNPASVIVTNQQSVVLVLSFPLAEDTDYTVTASGIVDIVGNAAGPIQKTFHSWVQGPGNGLLLEAFDAGVGVEVATLTASPNFPDNAFLRTNLWAFESRLVFPDDTQEQYGSRIRGVFIPPVSGDWVFFLRTYDRGEFHLNPNGLDSAGKQLVVAETTGNEPRDWNKFQSTPIRLRAGQAYYIESLQKADAGTGNGADAIKVAARLAGTGQPALGVAITELDTNAVYGAPLCAPFAPRDLGGTLTIVQQPANVATENFHTATFSVQVSNPSGLPVSYQWSRDGAEIPGANGPSYSFQATLADSGATFSVRAAKLGSVVTSSTASLSVVPDVTPPTVFGARGHYPLNRAIVSFSEEVAQGSAEDLFSYGTDGTFGVVSAVRDATRTNVVLTFDTVLQPDNVYSLTINFVEDLSGQVMTEAANVTFRTWVRSRGFALEELYLDIGAGTLVSDLTGSTKFPNSPDVVTWVTTLEGPYNSDDNYGTRLSGWLAPPVDGDYLLYMCSDDGGELRLSADDDPAGLQLIAQETSYNPLQTWTGDRAGGTRGTPPSNISTNPIAMFGGSLYAFEALAKEGGGDDNLGVTWQIPGQPVPVNNSPGIAGAHLYCLADPVGASVTIIQQPADFPVATLPATATFTVGAEATVQGAPNATLITYLWQRDDGAGFNDILGAYGSGYSVVVGQADVGARFRALVFSPGASATSASATVGGTSRPTVSISRQGNVIRVSWPLPGTGITLQQAPSLEGIPVWTTVPPNTYQTDATSVYVEVVLPAANAFYRLSQ